MSLLWSQEVSSDPLLGCWTADSWSVNPENRTEVDRVLQALNSPAPQSYYVFQRALTIAPSWEQALKACYFLIKADYQFVGRNGATGAHVGVDWDAIPVTADPEPGWKVIPRPENPTNTIQIAKEALKVVEMASEKQEPVDENYIQRVVEQVKDRLDLTLGTDIRGRTCADTAFTLALAGVTDSELYDRLSRITLLELERVGMRKAKRGKDILQIVEKLAASGVEGGDAERSFRVAAKCLDKKGPQLDPNKDDLATPGRFGLLSARPLIWLWRYSASLAKPKIKPWTNTTATDEWITKFEDSTRPLVVDVGCGLGVSLLGLASLPCNKGSTENQALTLSWADCNFVGGDLSLVTTRFAQGIAHRWGLSSRLQYPMCSTDFLLDQILNDYPGRTGLIMVQFPTPYRLDDTSIGNSQLPTDVESGFMIHPNVLAKIAQILAKHPGGRLLVQSNCEDVAVRIRDMAKKAGLRPVEAVTARLESDDSSELPQRTRKWIERGGERALGPEWWAESVLPPKCSTETEVACVLKGTTVHRCLFEVDKT